MDKKTRRRARQGPRPLRGRVTVPGDKSISHRALVLGAIARGRSIFEDVNLGADVAATARCLRALGVDLEVDETKGRVEVQGDGWDGLSEPESVLDVGNSGTTIRTLAAVCAGIDATAVLTGDASIRRRPMLRVVGPLRQMGALIQGRAHGDRAPLAVTGGDLTGIDLEMHVASAQVKTAVLLAGLRARDATSVTEPAPSRDHTERMLTAMGVEVRRDGSRIKVDGGRELSALTMRVPGDLSAAMFVIVAALITDESDVTVDRVGLNPTRTAALDVLLAMGADLQIQRDNVEGGEPVGSIRARSSRLHAVDIGPARMPELIDEIPALAVAAAHADGRTVVSGAGELRVKESDRIASIVSGIAALGARAEDTPDGFVIEGGAEWHGGEVDSHGDHRIAMALAIAGLAIDERVTVKGWRSVETSFPHFLDTMARAQRGEETK